MDNNVAVVLSALIGAILSGSGLTWIFKIRENKVKAGADVAGASAGAMTKLMKFISDQQEQFNKIIAEKDNIIEQQRQLIDKYKSQLEEAYRKIKELEYRIGENDRKIAGMQKVIDEYALKNKTEK